MGPIIIKKCGILYKKKCLCSGRTIKKFIVNIFELLL